MAMTKEHEHLARTLTAAQFALWQYIDSPTRQKAETLALCIHQATLDHMKLSFTDGVLPLENSGRPTDKVKKT
jgi:hypothetical protein